MELQQLEIDELGNAFVVISSPEYTPEQLKFLTGFLNSHALDLNKEMMKKTFNDKIPVIDALNVLNGFATHYHSEKPIIDEFQEECEHLVIALNDMEGLTI